MTREPNCSVPMACFIATVIALSLAVGVGCDPGARSTTPTVADSEAGAPPPSLRQQAVGRDPEPSDEALYDLINALKDRFACNTVSGCPAHAALVAYGWGARPLLEALFARAPQQSTWRSRTVAVVADLGDPQAQPFLQHLLDDRDPEVRAYAILGLGRIDARDQRARIRELADTSDSLWSAPVKVAALFVLAGWGEPGCAQDFTATLADLAGKQLATTALMIGAHLCAEPIAPDCRPVLPAMASHPAFQARRDALRTMQRMLRPEFARSLVRLTGDPAQSIRREAENALMGISGRTDVKGHAAWLQWCQSGGCQQN